MLKKIKKNYFLLVSTFLIIYFFFNLLSGQRGLISYFDKKRVYEQLVNSEKILTNKIEDLEHKISLVKNNDLDYIDMLYREKFRYGAKDEIIIKLK